VSKSGRQPPRWPLPRMEFPRKIGPSRRSAGELTATRQSIAALNNEMCQRQEWSSTEAQKRAELLCAPTIMKPWASEEGRAKALACRGTSLLASAVATTMTRWYRRSPAGAD
jgi:hypothetical protein